MLSVYQGMREDLLCALNQCRDVKATADCAALYLDKLCRALMAEAAGREERGEIERLFAAAKQGLLCMQAITQAEVTVKRTAPQPLTGWAKVRSLLPYVALAIGAVLCVWLILEEKKAAAVLCVPLMALSLVPKPAQQPGEEATAAPRADVYELMRLFDRLTEKVEALLETRKQEQEAHRAPSGAPLLLTDGLLEPLQMLMEASLTQDGRYALKTLPQVREALRLQGVQAVDFSEETRAYFEMFPSEQGGRTIRPALLREGKLLLHGQATESIG